MKKVLVAWRGSSSGLTFGKAYEICKNVSFADDSGSFRRIEYGTWEDVTQAPTTTKKVLLKWKAKMSGLKIGKEYEISDDTLSGTFIDSLGNKRKARFGTWEDAPQMPTREAAHIPLKTAASQPGFIVPDRPAGFDEASTLDLRQKNMPKNMSGPMIYPHAFDKNADFLDAKTKPEANLDNTCSLDLRQYISPLAKTPPIPEAGKGMRFNSGKTQLSYMLDADVAMAGMCKVFEFGAEKYARGNWKSGFGINEVRDSLLRHMTAHANGEILDPESGLPHIDHITCNAVFLATFGARA
tara:strand:+ start:699 stop:1589 length:891 start_codon:yes stop_codon:yes gene_type:complete